MKLTIKYIYEIVNIIVQNIIKKLELKENPTL